MRRRPALVLLALLATALPATAAPPPVADPAAALKDAERELEQRRRQQHELEERARQLEEERRWLSGQLVGLADQARRREEELADVAARLTRLGDDERRQTAALDAGRARLAALLAALQRLARMPPEAALLQPAAPADALRAALVLRDMAPALRAEAESASAALTRLTALRKQLEDGRRDAQAARQDIAAREQQIVQLAARRETLARQTDAERQGTEQRLARLAAQAGDLRQLLERIEQERRTAEKKFPEKKESERKSPEAQTAPELQAESRPESRVAALGDGGLRRPAIGRLTARFGQTDQLGAASRGLTIAARPGSVVVAPYSGSIMYAGPFRSFGLILIVDHGNGYHSLLAGLGRIDVGVGRQVAAGEPLGTAPEPDDAAGDGGDGGRDIYFELRAHGRPVDPERGFADKQGKGHG